MEVTDNLEPRLTLSVLEDSLDLFASHVRSVPLNMITAMAFANPAQTSLQILTIIVPLSLATTVLTSVQMA